MDSEKKISINYVIRKERLWGSSKQKEKMEGKLEYLDGILISNGHQQKKLCLNQDSGIHFYFY